MNLCAEVDLEVLGVVKDVQEGAALVKLGDAAETVQKLERARKASSATQRVNHASLHLMTTETETHFSF